MTNTLNSLVVIAVLLLFACSNEMNNRNDQNDSFEQSTEIKNMEQYGTGPFLIRTYFDGGTDWSDLTEKLTAEYEMGYSANLNLINDQQNESRSTEEVVKNLPEDYPFSILFVADSATFIQDENTVLCVDLLEEPGRSFRVIPSELWSVENNLSITNMDYVEFYENCDEKGIFRGFK